MTRKLASIRTIREILPIENADALELAMLDGWQAVVKKSDNFRVGDLVVYCEIDSILPEKPEYEFLRKSKFRIKTIRLRGCLSQGLVLPMIVLPEGVYQEGDEVTEILGITKYEPDVHNAPGNVRCGHAKGKFFDDCRKTDEERVQNLRWLLEKYRGTEFYITEKLEGSSITNRFKGEFGVASRNLELKDEEGSDFWNAARRMNVGEKLQEFSEKYGINLALQGELIGPRIQGNIYELTEQTIRFFQAWDIDRQQFLDYDDFVNALDAMNLPMVPLLDSSFVLDHTIEQLLEMADGPSTYNPNHLREGIVLRPKKEMWDPKLGRLSFKVVSNKYLEKQK